VGTIRAAARSGSEKAASTRLLNIVWNDKSDVLWKRSAVCGSKPVCIWISFATPVFVEDNRWNRRHGGNPPKRAAEQSRGILVVAQLSAPCSLPITGLSANTFDTVAPRGRKGK